MKSLFQLLCIYTLYFFFYLIDDRPYLRNASAKIIRYTYTRLMSIDVDAYFKEPNHKLHV